MRAPAMVPTVPSATPPTTTSPIPRSADRKSGDAGDRSRGGDVMLAVAASAQPVWVVAEGAKEAGRIDPI